MHFDLFYAIQQCCYGFRIVNSLQGAGINGKAVQITSPTTNLIIIGDSLIPSSGQNLILGNSSQAFRWANVYTYNVTNYRTTYTGGLQVGNRSIIKEIGRAS